MKKRSGSSDMSGTSKLRAAPADRPLSSDVGDDNRHPSSNRSTSQRGHTTSRSKARGPASQASSSAGPSFWSGGHSARPEEQEVPPRAFAPGLAVRKEKVDEYDPDMLFKPDDKYKLLKVRQHAEAHGTWSTIDLDDRKRTFDPKWYQERKAGNTPQPTESGRSDFWGSNASAEWGDDRWGAASPKQAGATTSVHPAFEDPDLDVDPEVRERFRAIGELLYEDTAPRTAFEQRNEQIMPKKTSAPVKVLIGGEQIKTLRQEADTRGEYQDQFGNYVEKDLGRMKKHLVEDRAAKIKQRKEEMVSATKEKRAWDALDPEERERQRAAKRQAPIDIFAPGPGAADCDIFDFAEIPAVYSKKVMLSDIDSWNRSQRGSTTSGDAFRFEVDSSDLDLSRNRDFEPFTRRVGNAAQSSSRGGRPTSGRSAGQTRPSGLPSGIRQGQRDKTVSENEDSLFMPESTTTETPSAIDPGPKLAELQDIVDPVTPIGTGGNVKYDQFEAVRTLCTMHGRIVRVKLHEPVHYSAGAIVARIFGGVVQEVQLYPKERSALVVFAFPGEAQSFVRHVKACRARDRQAYRALQIDATWAGGEERTAIEPIQRKVLMLLIDQDARRVLIISKIPLEKVKEDFAEEMRLRLNRVLVKVALVKDPRRYVQKRDGKQAIIEFVSIKDAFEVKRTFEQGLVAGYEQSMVGWLADSCDRKPTKSLYCSCEDCDPE